MASSRPKAVPAAAELLRSYAADSAAELERLLRTMVFTALIGNADAHAKNVALRHPTPETVDLAPLYDTVPTALWPKLRRDAAMSVAGNRLLAAITVDDLEREARGWSVARSYRRSPGRSPARSSARAKRPSTAATRSWPRSSYGAPTSSSARESGGRTHPLSDQ